MLGNRIFMGQHRLLQSKFVRNVAVVATGAAGAQLLNMAFTPIITRIYGPEAFGLLGAFVAILTLVTPFASLNFPMAMVLPKRDIDAIGLAKLSIITSLVTALLATLFLLVFNNAFVTAFNLQEIESFIPLLPLAMILATAMAVGNQWVIRKKLFKIKAQVTAMQALWLNIAKVGIGILIPTAAILVVLTVLGNAAHAFMTYLRVKTPGSFSPWGDIERDDNSPATLKSLARRHSDFAYYRTPQIFLNGLSQSLPVLILASFAGPAAAGFYSLGRTVLGIPSTLVGQSVSSVFYPRFNEAVQNKENSYQLLLKATLVLAAVGGIPFGIVVIIGPWLFTLVFGEQWTIAGSYAQWLALWTFFGFINRPSIAAIPVLALQGYFLIFEAITLVIRAAALAVGFIYFNDALTAVALFSGVNVVSYLTLVIATLFYAKQHDNRSPE